MTDEERIWWYAADGQEFGPYTAQEMESFVLSGRLTPDDLIWREGLEKWVRASSVKGLFDPDVSPRSTAPSGSPVPESSEPVKTAEPFATTSFRTSGADRLSDDQAMRIFVGDKHDHYVGKWRNLAEKKPAWSWVGFFLTAYWMIYRKMYRHAALLLAAMAVMEIFIYGLDVSSRAVMVVNLAFNILIGLQGNYWYKLHAEQKIQRIRENIVPEKIREELALQGGTNLREAIFCFFLVKAVTAVGVLAFIRTMQEMQKMGAFPPQ